MAATLTLVYQDTSGASLDLAYYRDRHVALIHETFDSHGLEQAQIIVGEAALDGGAAPFRLIALLHFPSAEHIGRALQSPSAGRLLADVANFTTISPSAQISRPL